MCVIIEPGANAFLFFIAQQRNRKKYEQNAISCKVNGVQSIFLDEEVVKKKNRNVKTVKESNSGSNPKKRFLKQVFVGGSGKKGIEIIKGRYQ